MRWVDATNSAECFPRWRTETNTTTDGKIVELQTSSDFDHRRSGAGVRTFFH